jgi:hypothetical protein
MCGGGPAVTAPVDPAAEQAKTDAKAATAANQQAAAAKRLKQRQGLLASGASATAGTAQTTTALASGKPLLGG